MTYRELQAALKQYRADGYTVECKLNADLATLTHAYELVQAEMAQEAAVEKQQEAEWEEDEEDEYYEDDELAKQEESDGGENTDHILTERNSPDEVYVTGWDEYFDERKVREGEVTERAVAPQVEETWTQLLISLGYTLLVLTSIRYSHLFKQAVSQLKEVQNAITSQKTRPNDSFRANWRDGFLAVIQGNYYRPSYTQSHRGNG